MRGRRLAWVLVVALCLTSAGWTVGGVLGETYALPDGRTVGVAVQGVGSLTAPNYDWWYGCSPTSAGMMMGYYDINGYAGLDYDNLVPGGVAEMNTFGNPSALANSAIASSGHIADFWVAYGESEDTSVPPNPPYEYADPMAQNHSFDCLADFMGTSQDDILTAAGYLEGDNDNVDGGTTFVFFNDGSKTRPADLAGTGWDIADGMFGMGEYVSYAGYGASELYTQLTENMGLTYGFTFAEFMTEIDNGRPVLVHVEGHTMLGYGYDDTAAPIILVYDTWDGTGSSSGTSLLPEALGAAVDLAPGDDGENPGWMLWGGAYGNERELWGVSVFTPAGGTQPGGPDIIPEPATVVLLAGALVAMARRRRKK